MTIYDLLAVTAFFMPIIAAFDQAKRSHLGLGGYALLMLVGLVFGTACIWGIYRFMDFVQNQSKDTSKHSQTIAALVTLLVVFAWIGLAEFGGNWIASMTLHLVFRHG